MILQTTSFMFPITYSYKNIIWNLHIRSSMWSCHYSLFTGLGILFFHKILQLDKLQGHDFKYDSIIFKIQSKNTQTRHWFQVWEFLFFTRLCNKRNLRAQISIFTILFSNSSHKINNFWFCTNLCVWNIRNCFKCGNSQMSP